jgi:molecular chaperone GrpE
MSNTDQTTAAEGGKWKKFSEEPQANEQETSASHQADQAQSTPEVEFTSRTALEDQLTALEGKVREYEDQALRAKAQLANVQLRAEKDVAEAHRFGVQRLLGDLLPVVDSLERSLGGFSDTDPAHKGWMDGIRLTLDMLHNTLTKYGVVFISPEEGASFDPSQHEAMSMQPIPGAAPNTIVTVLQKGFLLHGRVLRAAMVIVSK